MCRTSNVMVMKNAQVPVQLAPPGRVTLTRNIVIDCAQEAEISREKFKELFAIGGRSPIQVANFKKVFLLGILDK